MPLLDDASERCHRTGIVAATSRSQPEPDRIEHAHALIVELARALARQAAREDDAAERGEANGMLIRRVP